MGKLRPSLLALCLFIFAVGLPTAQAQWATNGNVVTDRGGSQEEPSLVPDGEGGALIVWTSGGSNIYMQRIDDWGNRPWGTTDIPVCIQYETQIWPSIATDGAGGAFIAWYDDRGSSYHTYAQHMDNNGLPVWAEDGIWIDTGSSFARMLSDGVGGAFIAWNEASTYPTSIAAQRLTPAGAKMWSIPYIIYGTGNTPRLLDDGAGGVILGWQRAHVSDYTIVGARVDASGATVWGAQDITTSWGYFMDAELVPDGAGGAIYVWGNGARAQRVNAAGVEQWAVNGVTVISGLSYAGVPQAVSDGAGGAIVVVRAGDDDDYFGWDNDIHMNRIEADGSLSWGTSGLTVCGAPLSQTKPAIAPDGHGGAFVVWVDLRNYDTYSTDIYAQHVDADGNPQWAANGVPICNAPGAQMEVQITATSPGSAIVTWEDTRDGGTTPHDIYAQAIHDDGSIGDPPFKVIATSPILNTIHVPLYKSPSVTFNDDVNLATLTSSTVVIHGSLSGLHEMVVQTGFKTISFNPLEDFDHG